MYDSPQEGIISKRNAERITNGFFAFTMTLLVRSIPLPAESLLGTALVMEVVTKTIPSLLTYFVTFPLLALYWFTICRIFRSIGSVNRAIVYLIVLFVMFLVFVPYTSEVAMRFEGHFAPFMLHVNLLILSLILIVFWMVSKKERQHTLHPIQAVDSRIFMAKLACLPLLSVTGLIFSFLGYNDTENLYYLILPVFFLILREPDTPLQAAGTTG